MALTDSSSPTLTTAQYLRLTSKSSTFAVNHDSTLSDADLPRHCALDSWHDRSVTPEMDLGLLDSLPLELQQIILAQTDLQTLVRFRQVNKRAIQIVNSVPEYCNIFKTAPNVLRATLSIETATYTSSIDLWSALTSSTCEDCNDFAPFIYLPLCRRVCYPCSAGEDKYFPLTPSEAARCYGVTQAALKDVPKFRSVPGKYSFKAGRCRARITLIEREAARNIGIHHHGSEDAMEWSIVRVQRRLWKKYYDRRNKNAEDGHRDKVRRPKLLVPPDPKYGNVRRSMALVATPVFDKVSMVATMGRTCIACPEEKDRRKEYTFDSFAEHIRIAGQIRVDEGGHHDHVPPVIGAG